MYPLADNGGVSLRRTPTHLLLLVSIEPISETGIVLPFMEDHAIYIMKPRQRFAFLIETPRRSPYPDNGGVNLLQRSVTRVRPSSLGQERAKTATTARLLQPHLGADPAWSLFCSNLHVGLLTSLACSYNSLLFYIFFLSRQKFLEADLVT